MWWAKIGGKKNLGGERVGGNGIWFVGGKIGIERVKKLGWKPESKRFVGNGEMNGEFGKMERKGWNGGICALGKEKGKRAL